MISMNPARAPKSRIFYFIIELERVQKGGSFGCLSMVSRQLCAFCALFASVTLWKQQARKRKSPETLEFQDFFHGGPDRDRTGDLTDANRTRSQLRYRPQYFPVHPIIRSRRRFVKRVNLKKFRVWEN